MRRHSRVVVLWVVASAMPVLASAAGDLDPTFNNGGVARASAGGPAYGVVVQPDGKLVVGGWSGYGVTYLAGWDFGLVRYNPNGSLDRAFGNAGVVTTEMTPHGPSPSGDSSAYLRALVLQPDNRLIAAGTTAAANGGFGLARYNPDGSLDPTFGSSGKVITSISDFGEDLSALALRPDGRLIAAGSSWMGANGSSRSCAGQLQSGRQSRSDVWQRWDRHHPTGRDV